MKLRIREQVYKKWCHWVDKAPGEVSGLGSVEVIDGIPTVTDVFLVKQINTGASTEMDAAEVSKLLYEHRDKDLRWWVHSHATMGVFWSGTDKDTIKELGGQGWIVATVTNKKKEIKNAFYSTCEVRSAFNNNEPYTSYLYEDDIEAEIVPDLPMEVIHGWDAEYDKTCTVRTFQYSGVASDVWAERRNSPAWSLYMTSRCCGNWETFLVHHSSEIAALLDGKQQDLPVDDYEFEEDYADNPGEAAAALIRSESNVDFDRRAYADYQEVRDDCEDLYEQSLPLEECERLVTDWYGEQYAWIAKATYNRLDYQSRTGTAVLNG